MMSHSTKLWLIWVGVFILVNVVLIVGIGLTWGGIASCVLDCKDKCPTSLPPRRQPIDPRLRSQMLRQ